jgi:hypothetical protein
MHVATPDFFVPVTRRERSSEDPVMSERLAQSLRLVQVTYDRRDPRVRQLAQASLEGDPLADAVVEWIEEIGNANGRKIFERALTHGVSRVAEAPSALRALFAQVDRLPDWLDRSLVVQGARVMHRHGPDAMTALGAALMAGYMSCGATKPLTMTGALTKLAPQRLDATARFTQDLANSSTLARDSDGFKTTLRVRLMHAQVRRFLARSPAWQLDAWGVPINQRDLVLTHLQFTVAYLAGVAALGRMDSASEREAVMHRWRYVSYLLGVEDVLLPKSFQEGCEILAIFNHTEAGPDEGGRALAEALVHAFRCGPAAQGAFGKQKGEFLVGFARYFLGEECARKLGLPNTPWRHGVPLVAALATPWELLQWLSPGARRVGQELGRLRLAGLFRAPSQYGTPTRQPYRVPV